MAANGALVKARRLTTACWILLVTETETTADSLDTPSGAEREGTIPINPIHRGARQGTKCATQMKLTWYVECSCHVRTGKMCPDSEGDEAIQSQHSRSE